MLALGLSLAYVMWASAQGIPAAEFVPVTMVITAVLYGLPAVVTFLFLKERALPSRPMDAKEGSEPVPRLQEGGFKVALRQLRTTYLETRHYPDFGRFLLCTVSYQAGVAVAITIAAIYAEQVIGFKQQETMMLIFALNLAAAAGAFAFGYIQDRLGHKGALALTLLMWIATCAVAAWSSDKAEFWFAATLAGLSMGSSQSAGRAITGLLSPEAQRAEFFALWTVAIRLASILGPLSYGAITWVTGGEHRVAIASTSLFFVVALGILTGIDVKRGQVRASNANEVAAG
jgi:UMF1 family MFS transporter